MKNKKKILFAIVAICLIVALIIFLILRSKIRATTMRLLRIEGTVTMQEDGKNKDVRENLRLKSGNALDTAASSLVSIGLDDHKIVTLDELSRAEFNQEGKYLNLNLTKGSIFFEVDKALAADESFEIETSTMIVGIRGTSGWVSVSGEHESLIITDGHVHVVGTNPVTGEVKEIDVNAGQRINVYLYNDRTVDSIMFELEDITERDLPEFVLKMLRSNSRLLDRVVAATGWDKPWILGLDDTEPEGDAENSEGGNGNSGNNTTGNVEADNNDNKEGEGIADVGGNDDVPGDVGGNDDAVADNTDNNAGNNAADNNNANNAAANEPAPAVAPEKTALEQQIEAAQAQIVSENADGTITLIGGNVFDPDYYASKYPDVASAYGTEPEELLAHYVATGQSEGRYATAQEEQDALVAAAIAELEAKAESDRWNAANNTQTAANNQTTQQTNQTTQQTNQQQQQQQQQQTVTSVSYDPNTATTTFANGVTGTYNTSNNSITIVTVPAGVTTFYFPVEVTNTDTNAVTTLQFNVNTINIYPGLGITTFDATAGTSSAQDIYEGARSVASNQSHDVTAIGTMMSVTSDPALQSIQINVNNGNADTVADILNDMTNPTQNSIYNDTSRLEYNGLVITRNVGGNTEMTVNNTTYYDITAVPTNTPGEYELRDAQGNVITVIN